MQARLCGGDQERLRGANTAFLWCVARMGALRPCLLSGGTPRWLSRLRSFSVRLNLQDVRWRAVFPVLCLPDASS
jgi:hypothetical protein